MMDIVYRRILVFMLSVNRTFKFTLTLLVLCFFMLTPIVNAQESKETCGCNSNLSLGEVRDILESEGVKILDNLDSADKNSIDQLTAKKAAEYQKELENVNFKNYQVIKEAQHQNQRLTGAV